MERSLSSTNGLKDRQKDRTRAIILGPSEIAQKIQSSLSHLNIDSVVIGSTFGPLIHESDLRQLLKEHPSLKGGAPVWIHPGISTIAEKPFFPTVVIEEGHIPISQSARVLSLYSNKVSFFSHAEQIGIPHLALSLDPFQSAKEIRDFIDLTKPRFPLLLKSISGGAGFGTQLIRTPEDLGEILPCWLDQLHERYDDSTIIIEKTLTSARHLIVPFAAFSNEEIKMFPIIDGSLQSRWKRFIQFCPAMGIDADQIRTIEAWVKKWTKSLSYCGFGTLEFLVEGSRVYLIDGSARMNAAFPLSEGVCGESLVEWQLASLGMISKPIEFSEKKAEKAGVSIRLYAEDPVRQLPSAGFIQEMTEVREWNYGDSTAELLSAFQAPLEVKTTSSGVLGELFVFAHDRKRAIQSAVRILSEFWIAGSVITNQKFSLEHLNHPFVRENLFHAGFSDEEFIPETNPDSNAMKRLVTIANRLLGSESAKWIVGGLWVDPLLETVEWLQPVQSVPSEKGMIYSGFARFSDGQTVRFSFYPVLKERWVCRIGIWQITLRRVILGSSTSSTSSFASQSPNSRILTSLVSGRVHALFKKEGTYCEPRQRLIMVESLGQLVQHAVIYPSQITEWLVKPGDQVEVGEELARLELLR